MAKKKTTQKAKKAGETEKLTVLVPADWMPAIDAARGQMKLSDFVRACIRSRIDGKGLSEIGSPGRPWPEH